MRYVHAVVLACFVPTTVSADDDTRAEQQLVERRSEYVEWVADTFGKLEPAMDPRDGRRWALNQARLVLNRDLDKANRHFASFGPVPRDRDIYFIRFLKTLLDFRDSPRLSEKAEAHIIGILKSWPQNALTSLAHWPPRHTENHDLMHLTIGMFAQQYRGGDVSDHVREIKQFLAWRFERGFVEWNSKCYQYHFSNPLIVLVDHAPDDDLRRGAQALLNVMLAERALLSVNGYLAGPSFRCRSTDAYGSLTNRKTAYLMDARYDGFLPTVWLTFGMGEPRFDFAGARVPGLEPATIHIASGNEPRLKQDEGMFFACSAFRPHPIVRALAEEAKTRRSLIYKGRRFLGWPNDWSWKTQRWLPGAIYYYNTPHVSMGSVHSDGAILQSRYNSVLFGADPSQGLRVEVILPDVPPNKRRYEVRGRVVQHKNWLLGQGTLFEDGGAKSRKVGRWNVYRVGKGLCAHMELPDFYHVLQVSDLDTFADEESFVAALSVAEKKGDRVDAVTMDGDRIVVNLKNMSISINDAPRPHPPKMLHDCESMKSEYGSGKITIKTKAGSVTFDAATIRPRPPELPALPKGAFRWESKVSEPRGGDVFLLPYFLGNGETGVYLACSRDGLHFKWLNDGKVVMPAPSWGDESLTRDPSILYHDGLFHMVWTTSWNSRTIGHAHSKDLLHWSRPGKIDIWGDFTAVRNTWAPELHWDPERNEFLIIWSSTTLEELRDNDGSVDPHGNDHRSYAARTRDFKTFTKPKLFYSPQSPELSVIDPFIAHDDRDTADKSDDRWVMVIKNEMGRERGGKNLRLVFGKRMQGPYDTKLGPPIVGAGTRIVDTMGEGPSLIRYNKFWYLYWDAPGSTFPYCLATSPDLAHWTNRSQDMSLPTKRMRHGTVLVVPESAVASASNSDPK